MKTRICTPLRGALALLFIQMLLQHTVAQEPAAAQLHVNNAKVTVNANGALFTDLESGQFMIPNLANENGTTSLMRAAGLWIGGLDPADNLKLAAQTYNDDGAADFQPGLLDPSTGEPAELLKNIYRVTAEEIDLHLADFADNGVIDNPQTGVFGWPGHMNPFFPTYNEGDELPDTQHLTAAFYDLNSDGIYNPDQGEYPILGIRACANPTYADEMLWFVFNDALPHTQSGGIPLQLEVQTLVFAYNCQESPLGNSIFVHHKLFHFGSEALDSCYIGQFSDFDIGNPDNDLFGIDSERFLAFAYNGYPDDDDDSATNDSPPVIALDIFRAPFQDLNFPPTESSLAFVQPADIANLSGPVNYYNLLSGSDANGAPAPFDGLYFDGDPNNSDAVTEVSLGNVPGNRRVLTSHGPFNLYPGSINEFVMAYTFYQVPGNSHLQNVAVMYEQTDAVQDLFDNCFAVDDSNLACTPNTTISGLEPAFTKAKLTVYPNPADQILQIELPDIPLKALRIYDALGHLVIQKTEIPSALETLEIDLSTFAGGLYLLQALDMEGRQYQSRFMCSKR